MANQFTSNLVTFIIKAYQLQTYSLLLRYSIKSKICLFNLFTIQIIRKYSFHTYKYNEFYTKNMFNTFTSVYTSHNQSLIIDLSNILSIDKYEALKIWKEIIKYKVLTREETINMITVANKAGLSVSSIVENLPILIKNINTLEEKIRCIQNLDSDITEMLPLLNISRKYLDILMFIEEERSQNKKNKINKIKYLADELQCSVHTLCKYIENQPTVITISIRRIKTIIKILKEFDYELKDILVALWIFNYNARTIHRRSSMMQAAGMQNIKPWIIRSSVHELRKYIKKLRKQQMLNDIYGSHVDFLVRKLNITEDEVRFYINRSPDLLDIPVNKMNEVINILQRYGYNAQDILMCQRIFLLRTTLLEERLKILQQLRGKHRLSLVYCSAKIFETIVKYTFKLNSKTTSNTDDK
ncbi:transcription termination factor, mitochondrial [Vespa velutina]|uniref:transcription termination factor, mitochondrial n=1 Tax=Vespa velutina TaxID=202808 RepID=UPI001FB4A2BA|nr:transcription termination factor, mitochondrial [Vespa velutina]